MVLLLACAAAFAVDPALTIKPTDDPTRVEVTAQLPDNVAARLPAGDIDADTAEPLLRFSLIDADTAEPGPAIFGRYERVGRTLRFTPRYALTNDQRYRATLTLSGAGALPGAGRGKPIVADYRVPPRQPTPPTVVEAIYPSASELPANLLKFYIHFSQPMREGRDIFDHIHVVNASGQEVNDPWRRIDLWNADSTRLTIWVHPGRVKQGVNLRLTEGPVLVEGRKYSLVIDADLLDAHGQPLGKAYTKKFAATAEDHTRPTIDHWKFADPPPEVGTRQPISILFNKPLDRWLLERDVHVSDDEGRAIEGRIVVGREEKSWSFHPAQPWRDATHVVTVNELMEDLAGNTPLRVFDTDLTEPAPPPGQRTMTFRPTKRAP
jgi:hypothetical protein